MRQITIVCLAFLTACFGAPAPSSTPTIAPMLTIVPPTETPPPPTTTALPPTATPTVVPTTLTPTPTPTPSPVVSALNALAITTNRQRAETTLLSDGKVYTSVIEYIAPDRFHFVSASDDIMVIGQKVYVRQKSVFVESSIPATSIVDFRGLERAGEGIDGIKSLGAELLNGQQTLVYEYEQRVKTGDTEASIWRTVWIDAADKLLRKMIIDGVSLGIDTKTGNTAYQKSRSIVLFEYDPSIKIELPIK